MRVLHFLSRSRAAGPYVPGGHGPGPGGADRHGAGPLGESARATGPLAALFGAGRAARHRRLVLRRLVAVAALVTAAGLLVDVLRPDPPPTRDVTVAARDLPAGHLLSTEDLDTSRAPADLDAIDQVMAAADLPGRVVATRVARGEFLSGTRLVPRTVAEGLPEGTAPFHVVVSDPRMLDLVAPGQRVRVHRARVGGLLTDDALVLAVDPVGPSAGLLPTLGEPERGLVLALPPEVIDAAVATPEPDGAVPRVHVVPLPHRAAPMQGTPHPPG